MSSLLEDLITFCSKLPGLGPRSSRRLILYLLKNKDTLLENLIQYLLSVREELSSCEECGNIDISSPCSVCIDEKRVKNKICVVEEVADLWAIEKSKSFNGIYHVLGGVLSAIDGVGPDQLNIKSLINKSKNSIIEEIIIATNATPEGQLTGQYIADQFSKTNIFISRLAHGMPIGSELDYIDEGTLVTAFKSRSKFD